MGHHYIGTEHLLLGLVRHGQGIALDVLRKLGVTPEQIRRQTRRVLQESTATSRNQVAVSKSFCSPGAGPSKDPNGRSTGGRSDPAC
jgi:ATP-dependent Clp protease ATP-binding subunit ClpC